MSRRDCLFAYTPCDYAGHYPPFINLTDTDGKVTLLVRGPQQGETPEGHPVCGLFVEVEIPPDVIDSLLYGLARWKDSRK
jgi:hypothetical protein